MKLKWLGKNRKALSLVEIMIVLLMVSTTLLSVTAINIRSQLQIVNNEILDRATGVLIKGVEIAKSPTTLTVVDRSGNPVTNLVGKYSLSITDLNNTTEGSRLIKQSDSDPTIVSGRDFNCDRSSPYYIEVLGVSTNPTICAQYIITSAERPTGTGTYLTITGNVFIRNSSGYTVNQVIGYRRVDV